MAIRILFLEDEVLDFELVSSLLAEEGFPCEFRHVKNKKAFEEAFKPENFDLVLSDYAVPGYSGGAALEYVRARSALIPFILLSGTLSEEQAVESLKAGATDYIIKQRVHRLAPAVRRALREAAEKAERARAEAALRESEQRIRNQAALLDRARDAILLIGMDQRIQYWNKSAERIFGWNEQEALGQGIEEFLIRGGGPENAVVLAKLLSDKEWRGEITIQTKEGKRIIVESRWSLMIDPDSPQPKGILLINTDVTEKKELEAQFLRTQRIETIGSLSGGIAHDLNNALSPIIMATELLSDDVTTEPGRRMLEMVRTSGKRCADMVKQILSFSRGAGQTRELIDACRLIEELAGLARETFPRLINIETSCEARLNPIQGNVTQLHQVIMNLLVNARDAMPRGGVIRLWARNVILREKPHKMLSHPASGSFVSVGVSDTGTGISDEIRERIFEPFFTTKEIGKGTGLGLSTVFSIVKSHSGFLELNSELGKGTTFELFFPARPVEEKKHPVAEPLGLKTTRGERILLVDDEEGLLAIVKNTLETFGYRVLTAGDGLAALEILEKNAGSIDLVLTDWMMPLMSGEELLRRMRNIAPHIHILVATGSELTDDRAFQGLNLQGILEKPYSTERLLEAISDALAAPVSAEMVS